MSKRTERIEAAAQAELVRLIADALEAAEWVDSFERDSGSAEFRVDMASNEACYVGPFVVTVALSRMPDGGGGA